MKKKGFTLIELLAVIVIIAIILAIAIPSVSGIIKISAKNTFEEDSKLLIRAIDIKNATDSTFDPSTLTASNVKTLLNISNDNYQTLTVTIVNGKTTVSILGKGKWAGYSASGNYNTITVVEVVPDTMPPVITLNNDKSPNPNSFLSGCPYIEYGATATDNVDGNLTSSIIIDISNLPTNLPPTPGTYIVTYSVTDSSGNTATKIRGVRFSSGGPLGC